MSTLETNLDPAFFGRDSEDLTEESIQQYESKAFDLELKFLLVREVPDVCALLAKFLKDSVQAINSCTVNTPPKDTDNGYLAIHHGQGCVKGYLLLDRWKIIKADVHVRMPRWRKNQVFQAYISPSRPCPLSQLVNAHNYMNAALGDVELLLLGAKQTPPMYSMYQVLQVMEQVASTLQRARDELTSTTFSATFPTAQHSASEVFEPAPPRDLVIDMHVGKGGMELVLVVHGLSAALMDMHHVPKGRHPVLDNDKAVLGQLYFHKNQWVELLDRVEVQIPLPHTAAVLTALSAAIEWSRRLRDRVLPHFHRSLT